jgi:hypothetical protein
MAVEVPFRAARRQVGSDLDVDGGSINNRALILSAAVALGPVAAAATATLIY